MKDRSILLSQAVLFLFFVMLLALDVLCFPACAWFAGKSWTLSKNIPLYKWLLVTTVYALSVPAYVAMAKLWKLLKNLKKGEMFTAENTRCLRHTCWCLTAAFMILILSTVYFVPFVIAALAAGFMALIVHIVKNAFEKALAMKDELDLTV